MLGVSVTVRRAPLLRVHTRYTLLVPRLDDTGPTNLAVELANGLVDEGWLVALLYISGVPSRDDLSDRVGVRRFKLRDLWELDGVLHSHGLRPDLLAWLFTFRRSVIVTTTLHGYFPFHLTFDHSRLSVKAAWTLWRAALRRFDAIYCLSRDMAEFYRGVFDAKQLAVAYNFRSPAAVHSSGERADIRRWISIQKKEARRVIVFVGSLSPRKNVRALVEFVQGSSDVSLILCGDGALRLEVQEASVGCGDRIFVAGSVSHPEHVIEQCDVLVLPSFAEGLPLVCIEAAMVGVPVLLSDIAVHRELAAMGFGKVFNHVSFDDARDKIEELLTSSRWSKSEIGSLFERYFSRKVGVARYLQETARLMESRDG